MPEPSDMPSMGDSAQIRVIAEQVVKAALVEVEKKHPQQQEAEVPTPLRWAAGLIAAIFSTGCAAMVIWLVTSVSEMQVTLARMDERLASQDDTQAKDLQQLETRVTGLEAYHRRRPND